MKAALQNQFCVAFKLIVPFFRQSSLQILLDLLVGSGSNPHTARLSFTATSSCSCTSNGCKFAVYVFFSTGLYVFLTEKLPGLDMYPLFILFEYKFVREEVFTFRELHVTRMRDHDRLKSLFSPHSFWLDTHLTARCMISVIDTVPLNMSIGIH